MSNKTQLQANNTQLASLIHELQGKAAGGGASVETCTFTVNGGYIIGAAVLDNGVISTVSYEPGNVNSQDNVVSGSVVFIRGSQGGEHSFVNCSYVYEAQAGYSAYKAIAIDSGATSASVTVQSDEPPEPI